MLFKGIEAFRGQLKSVTATIALLPDGKLSVIINPDPEGEAVKKNPGLGTQFSVIATAEELDSQLADAIGNFADARKSVADQANEVTSAMKASAAEVSAEPATGTSKPGSKGKPSVNVADLSGEVVSGGSGASFFDDDVEG